jgi:hypothetical protein
LCKRQRFELLAPFRNQIEHHSVMSFLPCVLAA